MHTSKLNESSKVEQFKDSPELMSQLLEHIRGWGKELGFTQIGVASVDLSHAEPGLLKWLNEGFHGDMQYMQTHGLKRARPAELVPGTLSVITARMNYLPRDTQTQDGRWIEEERARLSNAGEGVISVYARGRDYHKVMRQRLEKLAQKIQSEVGRLGYRVFTDSAPVLEVELGAQSGLGWRGKHTLLLSRDSGSMFFLGEIYLDLPLAPTAKEEAHCGTCRSCIDVCPTGAITKPYVLDARKCISYLTIEHAGAIPAELRSKIGNHIYGCDDCQTACPWNKYAQPSAVEDFDIREAWRAPPRNSPESEKGLRQGVSKGAALVDYFSWTAEEFDQKTQGSAIRRIGHERWLRNIAVAMGNALANSLPNSLPTSFRNAQANVSLSASPSNNLTQLELSEIEQALVNKLDHPSALVVEHIRWALDQPRK